MNAYHDEMAQLDEMLSRSYAPLREPVAGQREALLAALAQSRPADPQPQSRGWAAPIAWLATAACLAVVVALVALLVPSPAKLVYGIEAVPGRLAEVQTIRQRGYRMIYPRRGRDEEPIRVPVEYLLKRPDKFRITFYTAMHPRDAPMRVETKIVVCDGRRESHIWESNKECVTTPIAVLEAWMRAESLAQFKIAGLFGPPGTSDSKVGRETVAGHSCDVYEGRVGREDDDDSEFIWRLWIDPTTGYPVRSTQDEVLPDGSRRRVQSLEEIAVNVPLDDELFATGAPDGFRLIPGQPAADPTALHAGPSSSSGGPGGAKFQIWRALCITDEVALLVWRRSAPEPDDDGTSDWLSGVTFSLHGDEPRPAVHDWVYQSFSPDAWNWSLVAAPEGRLPDRGGFRIEFKTDRLHSRFGMVPLRFPEQGLARIIEAASRATLPEDGPQFKLEHLRTLAEQLLEREPKR